MFPLYYMRYFCEAHKSNHYNKVGILCHYYFISTSIIRPRKKVKLLHNNYVSIKTVTQRITLVLHDKVKPFVI